MNITKEEYLEALKKVEWLELEMSGVLKEFAEAIGKSYNNYYRGFRLQNLQEHGISYEGWDDDYEFVPIDFIFDRPAWEERRRKEREATEERAARAKKDLQESELINLRRMIEANPDAAAEILAELDL